MRTLPSFAALAVALAAAIFMPAAAASAHDGLESANPAADSSITADPGIVTLGFSDQLLTIGSDTSGFALQVVDDGGLHHESGCVAISGSQVTAPIALGGAGSYLVLWQVVSSDGHPTSGQYEFDYEPASLAGAADGLTDAPVCGEAWAGEPDGTPTRTATPSPSAAASAAPTASTAAGAVDATEAPLATSVPRDNVAAALPWPVVVLIVIVGLGVLAAVVVLVVRRTRGGGYGQ